METHDQSAKGRTTLIVTVASGGAHRFGKNGEPPVARAIMDKLNRDRPGRYDLLTVPDDAAGYDPQLADMLSEHIDSAAKRHGIKRVIVALAESSNHLADKLAAALPRITFHPTNLHQYGNFELPHAEHVVITCMDWRTHGADGGLLAALERIYGHGTYSLFAMAGGAKWLADRESLRGKYLIEFLAQSVQRMTPLTKIHLLCHTDCGGYGGNGAFANRDEQMAKLGSDLARAATNVIEATKVRWGIKVTSGIIELRDGRVTQITNA